MKKKILVVEDEPLIADSLEMIVNDTGYECIGQTDNVTDALLMIGNHQPDLILLDINLAGNQEGLDLAEILQKREKIPCVFISAYSDEKTVERSSKTDPYGYLVKPFNQSDVRVALKLAFAAIERKKESDDELISSDGTVYIKEANGYQKVQISEVQYVQADDIYAVLISGQQKVMISKSLKQLEPLLIKFGFIRIHKSYIINKNAVDKIKDGHAYVGNEIIPIGRAYKENLLSHLKVL